MRVPLCASALLSAIILLQTILPGRADTREDVIAGMLRCSSIKDDRTWLDCLYGADQPMRAKLGLPPAPEFQQHLVPPRTAALPTNAAPLPLNESMPTHKHPGFFASVFGDLPPYARSRMASYSFNKKGAFVVTLANGQVWQQSDVEAGSASWREPASRYFVTIDEGPFGSYTMRVSDSTRIYKVQRVQ